MPVFMLQRADAIFRGEPRFVGFPCDSGSGIALQPFLRLGMSASSANKEAVWDFFHFLLSDGYLTREKWNETPGQFCCLMCIPTTRSAYDFRMADGLPIELELKEHADEIPTLRLDGELQVWMPEDTSALTFYLLNGQNGNQLIIKTLYNGKRLGSPVVTSVSQLEGLVPGKYLFCFDFLRACVSNETEGLFDRYGDNCYFWLVIP